VSIIESLNQLQCIKHLSLPNQYIQNIKKRRNNDRNTSWPLLL